MYQTRSGAHHHCLPVPDTKLASMLKKWPQYPGGRQWGLPSQEGCAAAQPARAPALGGLHLLASKVAVSWVPKPPLLHLLVELKSSSDFVSVPFVPTYDNA